MSGECILIIDDSREMVKHLSTQLLPAFGFKTLQATNGQEGLRLIREKEPALVMLDLNLPRMTGLDVLQTMAAESLDVPVILMTGYGSEKSAIEAFRLGIKDYLVKPFTVEEVLNTIDRVLMESRLRHDKERLIRRLQRSEGDMRRQLTELNRIVEVGKEMLLLESVQDVLDHALDVAMQFTEAEGCVLWLQNEAGEWEQMTRGHQRIVRADLGFPAVESLVAPVLQSGRALRDSAFAGRGLEVVPGFYARAMLLVPLRLKEQITGVLAVLNVDAPQAFGEREQGMLTTLADFLALALRNARRIEAGRNREQAESLEELKSDFVMTVSHDLRAPLNSVIGFASALAESGSLNEQQELFVQHIIDSAGRMMELINLLLDLARLGAGLSEPQEICDVAAIVENVITDLRARADLKGVRLEIVKKQQPQPVWGSPARLAQAINNLLDNALRFSPAGERIRICLDQQEGTAEVAVADRGPGISEADLPYIFDQFYRVRNAANREGGAGLGLTLVRSIAEAHGGSVHVETKVGEGSTFRLRLPAQVA